MLEELLLKHCAPTLAGIKTASLFSMQCQNSIELKKCVCAWNKRLCLKGLHLCALKCKDGKALLYLYRMRSLNKALSSDDVCQFLSECGYCCKSPKACICQLKQKIERGDSFPHEIGVFLGYPLYDTQQFIAQKGKNFSCCGYWKVYGDAKRAEKTFALYKKCSSIYFQKYLEGKSINQLIVAA